MTDSGQLSLVLSKEKIMVTIMQISYRTEFKSDSQFHFKNPFSAEYFVLALKQLLNYTNVQFTVCYTNSSPSGPKHWQIQMAIMTSNYAQILQ